MPYIARKPSSFDRKYSIGEIIPDAVVDPARGASLVSMGRLSYIEQPENPEQENGEKPAQEAQEGADKEDGVATPDEPKKAAGEETEGEEPAKKARAKK